MYEFDSVSVSSYEATSLAAKLTEKSGDGWDVVTIVPAGSEITAYLRREKSGAPAETTAEPAAAFAASSTSSWETTSSGPAETPTSAVSEPAGWGSTPESTTTTPAATTPTQPASTTPTATQPATPAVPAGWYSDPARRYDLRYWDGSAWTEHVSRAGQQYTDPPVA
jgi:Protein of unknown function (DUF2510)